jgi:hypothetical protein
MNSVKYNTANKYIIYSGSLDGDKQRKLDKKFEEMASTEGFYTSYG